MADSRWWKDLDTVLAAALPAGSRILDAGCGDGGLVDRLAELGFDAVGGIRRRPFTRVCSRSASRR
jgi:2-polyprenyl-3-methyl-5-hydroxy-6-metoxy-1,4-benzoquinol methylase